MTQAPEQPTIKTNVLSLLVHGASKSGKSTLGSTAPPPILVIDAEGSWKFIRTAGFDPSTGGPNLARPLRRITWDPMQPPPIADGSWDLCVVAVTNWAMVRQIYAWLTQAPHGFSSIVLDSITELQRRLKANIAPDGNVEGYKPWGQLLVQMDQTIRGFRDLTIQDGPVRCAYFVAETRLESGRWRPYMQGQIGVSLPYWVDVCGYQYQQPRLTVDGAPGDSNDACLWIGQTSQFECGERVQGALPKVIMNPNIAEMIARIYATENTPDTSPPTAPLTQQPPTTPTTEGHTTNG